MVKIVFLAHNIYGVGGTVRTVINLANELIKTYSITIISVYRRVDHPSFYIDPRISVVPLVDMRPESPDRDDPMAHLPSVEVPHYEELYSQYSKLTDDRIVNYLTDCKADVVIGTRPSLNLLMARYAPENAILIAQEHMSASVLGEDMIAELRQVYPAVHHVVTVTEYEKHLFEEVYRDLECEVSCIPNSFTPSRYHPSTHQNPLIVAAGRITAGKRFELLIHAFHFLREEFPQWKVRIYGDGPHRSALKLLIQKLGLSNQIVMMGAYKDMAGEWVKGSIAVSTSDAESFGMTLIEAMHAGLAVVSTDCPVGPREIISDTSDGFLIPVDQVDALVDRLRWLMEDGDRRLRVGKRGVSRSRDFSAENVAQSYISLVKSYFGGEHREETTDHDSFVIPRIQHMSAISDSNVQFRVRVTVASKVPPIGMYLRFWSNTRKAKEFRTRFRIVGREGAFYHLEGHVSPNFFNTDAIWDSAMCYWGKQLAVPACSIDNRAVNDPTHLSDGISFAHVVPFASSQGDLRVRSWRRRRHAEVVEIVQLGSVATVLVDTILVADPLQKAVLIRRGERKDRINLPTLKDVSGQYQVTIDLALLARMAVESHEDWDLFLVDSRHRRTRVAKLLDDVVAKKHIYSFPAWNYIDEVSSARAEERVSIRPYLTVRNDVSFSVVSSKL